MFASQSTRRSLFALVVLAGASPALAGRVVAFGDEHFFSNAAFVSNPSGTNQLVSQLASFIGYGQANRDFLVVTSEFEVTQASFQNAMTGLGHTWTINAAAPITLANLQQYDAVFFSNLPGSGLANLPVLTQYVNGGGSVVLFGGTGSPGGAANEAAVWNPFLSTYGLQFNMPLIGPAATIQLPVVANTNPVASGVSMVSWGFGHRVSELNPNDPLTDLVLGTFQNADGTVSTHGIIGTFDCVPTPGTLMVGALGALCATRRRR